MVTWDKSPQASLFSQFRSWAKSQVIKHPAPAVTCHGRETDIRSRPSHDDQPLAVPVVSCPPPPPPRPFQVDQRATIYRVTVDKLRRKSVPLLAMVHLKNVMLQLEGTNTAWRRPPFKKVKPLLTFDDDDIPLSAKRQPFIQPIHGKAILA